MWRSAVFAFLCLVSCSLPADDGDTRTSLTGTKGDPVRGRAIVASRQSGLCLLCHRAPIPEERFQGNLGPDLADVGARLSEGQIRQRIVHRARANPDTIMPAYYRTDGLSAWGPPSGASRCWARRRSRTSSPT